VTAGNASLLNTHYSTVILAAGIGKRMHSKKVKVLHKILGKPMLGFVVDSARNAGSSEIVLVVGRQSSAIKKIFGRTAVYVRQPVPLGTGDAALRGIKKAKYKNILVLNGDIPLLRYDTIKAIIKIHKREKADLSFLTCQMKDPFGYGRVVRDKKKNVAGIVEHRDATARERRIREINVGVYFGKKSIFTAALKKIHAENAQGELYVTDVVRVLIKQKKRLISMKIRDEKQIQGINTKKQLAAVQAIVKEQWPNV
jgi:bifunctional UDP-N-acetylglucosamine pyrophosphorylase/glucosamine-1-phosphate N-acetyltransferase